MIAQYETLTGRTLQPGQVERLIISVMAYRETLVRSAIQDAAEQNLLTYARFPMLDLLGELVGVTRLGAQAAQTTIQFTLTGVQAADVLVPAGTRVQSNDAKIIFATSGDLTIAAGQLTGNALAIAQTTGAAGDGYIAGQVSTLMDVIGFVASAANTDTTMGGADQESDDQLRARIQQAPESFSVAGSSGAYRYFALSVSADIIDVYVSSPTPGTVDVCVLTAEGIPSDELLADVLAALSADTVRPLSDTVTASAPASHDYAITATIDPSQDADAATVMAAANAAASAYAADRAGGLGRDIIASQVIAALSVPGVYRVTLVAPGDATLGGNEWAHCTAITLTQGVTVDG